MRRFRPQLSPPQFFRNGITIRGPCWGRCMANDLILAPRGVASAKSEIRCCLTDVPGEIGHLKRYWPEFAGGAGGKAELAAFASTLFDLAGS